MIGLLLIVGLGNAMGDEKSDAHDFGAMSLPEATEAIKNASTGEKALQFTTAAFASRRMDLLKLCSETPYTWAQFLDGLKALPASPFKQELLIMMLRNPSAAWPDPGPSFLRPAIAGAGLGDALVPMIRECFPKTTVTAEMLVSRKERLRIATELEKGMR